MMGTDTLSGQRSPGIVGIFVICLHFMDCSFLVLTFLRIDGRSASNLSLSKSRTLLLSYNRGPRLKHLMNLVGQSCPIHRYNAQDSYIRFGDFLRY